MVRRIQDQQQVLKTYCCRGEAPSPWPNALCLCQEWFAENLGDCVEGYHLELPDGEVVGHLYYAPSERAILPYEVEPGVGVLYCEWIRQSHQGGGLSRRLFGAFLDDMRQQDAKGIAVECTDSEGRMHCRHYLTRGFRMVHESGHRKLLFLPLGQQEVRIRPLEPRLRPKRKVPAEILVIKGYMCPYETSTLILLREVAQEFGDQVVFREVSLTPETVREYGAVNGIFVNGRAKLAGGETEDSIRQAIREEL